MRETQEIKPGPELPRVAMIVAMTRDRIIGDQQGLPWHLPEDLQLFKRKTLGNTVIMGRKTYQSIGRALPGRFNIVLSRTRVELPQVKVCTSLMAGLSLAARQGRPVFIIGGADLYRQALPIAAELHISWVEARTPGDVCFPEFNLDEWRVCSESEFPGFKHIHYQRRERNDQREAPPGKPPQPQMNAQ